MECADPAGDCCDELPGTGDDVPEVAASFFFSLESLFLESCS